MCGYTTVSEDERTCLFVFCICTVQDFSAEDKASGVKLCTVVHRVQGWESHILGNFAPQKPKIDQRIGQRAH